ncbi:MAG TPA: IS1 family transposase [Pyrinomonadaceae bacterium]|jgi:IS1 family transposase
MNNQEITQTNNLRCPRCQLSHIKRNGHTYYGKQNYQCKLCDRQFVERRETVSEQKQELVKSLLRERISLRGICRVLKVSLTWLINFIEQLYLLTPRDLQFVVPVAAEIELFCLEADELWSFVERRENKRWVWLILERRTRQIIALHIGDRSQDSARALWAKVPPSIKAQALVLTDCWDAYGLAIPSNQHVACEKQSGQISLIERFNCTLRQRVSRLVRKSLSFSKSDWFHEEAIKYFIAHYNLERQKLFEHYF